jgi:hypothetical protein
VRLSGSPVLVEAVVEPTFESLHYGMWKGLCHAVPYARQRRGDAGLGLDAAGSGDAVEPALPVRLIFADNLVAVSAVHPAECDDAGRANFRPQARPDAGSFPTAPNPPARLRLGWRP